MEFKRFSMVRFVNYGPNINTSSEAVIYDTEIVSLRHGGVLFRVDTPFRVDELAHGPIENFRWCGAHETSILQCACSSASMNTEGDMAKYIAEVKYRREKNDRITALETEVKKVKSITERNPILDNLERENDELRKHVQALKRDNGVLTAKLESKLRENCEILRDARLEIEELKSMKPCVESESQPTLVAVPISACECSDLKAQVHSLKLQLATEKRISQKYARDLQEKVNQQSVLTAM